MANVRINLSPPRGSVRVSPSWTMSILEKAKAFPGKKKFVDKVLWFELSKENINYAKIKFPTAFFEGGEEDLFQRDMVSVNRPPFATAFPMDELQREAFERSAGKEYFAFFEKPGAGKTKIILDASVRLWCEGKADALLVVTYKGVHEQWVLDEAPKHIHSSIPWEGEAWSGKLKTDILKSNPEKFRIFSLNYEAYATSQKAQAAVRDFYRSGRVIIAADESQRLMDPDSLTSREITADQSFYSYRFAGSGEPTPRGIENYYSVFRFLHPSIMGVDTYAAFKARYCRLDQFRRIVGYHNTEELHRLMAPHVHVAAPNINAEQIWEESRFSLGPRAREAYNQMRDELLVQLDSGEIVTVQGALPKLLRLQQIACGFLPREDGVEEFELDRVQHTLSILQMNQSHKAIVWARFQRDHEALAQGLGEGSAVYNGNTKKEDRRDIVQRFLDPKSGLNWLIASTAAAGTGLNLQGSCWLNIYHSNSDNAGQRWQSEMRTFRRGVDRDVRYVDVIARSTVDNGILRRHRRKRDISDMSIAELRDLITGEE